MTQEEYSAFYDSIDFIEGALNVYRTKNYIVRQELSIENIEGKAGIHSLRKQKKEMKHLSLSIASEMQMKPRAKESRLLQRRGNT